MEVSLMDTLKSRDKAVSDRFRLQVSPVKVEPIDSDSSEETDAIAKKKAKWFSKVTKMMVARNVKAHGGSSVWIISTVDQPSHARTVLSTPWKRHPRNEDEVDHGNKLIHPLTTSTSITELSV